MTVATVAANGRTALERVQIGRDFGTRVEIVSAAAGDRVIDNPGDAITAGEVVKIVSIAHAAAPVAASSAQTAQPAPASGAGGVPPMRASGAAPAAPAASTPASAPARS